MPYIHRSIDSVQLTPATNAHGGRGEIQVSQILGDLKGSDFVGFPDDFEAPVNFVHHVLLPPNTSIGNHPHPNNEEFYYIISGVGTMIVDGESFQMLEGSICLIKKGSQHSFENNSDQDLKVMVVEIEFSKI